MNKDKVKALLEELLTEDGYNNPLWSGRDDIGEKYRGALQWVLDRIDQIEK